MRIIALALPCLLVACGGTDLSVTPDSGRLQGGEDIRIEGAGFVGHGAATVHFGQESAKSVVIEGDRLVRVKTPEVEEAMTVSVIVTFSDGTRFEIPDAFSYEARGIGIDVSAAAR